MLVTRIKHPHICLGNCFSWQFRKLSDFIRNLKKMLWDCCVFVCGSVWWGHAYTRTPVGGYDIYTGILYRLGYQCVKPVNLARCFICIASKNRCTAHKNWVGCWLYYWRGGGSTNRKTSLYAVIIHECSTLNMMLHYPSIKIVNLMRKCNYATVRLRDKTDININVKWSLIFCLKLIYLKAANDVHIFGWILSEH